MLCELFPWKTIPHSAELFQSPGNPGKRQQRAAAAGDGERERRARASQGNGRQGEFSKDLTETQKVIYGGKGVFSTCIHRGSHFCGLLLVVCTESIIFLSIFKTQVKKVLQPYLYPLSITSTALMDTEALCPFADSPTRALALKSQLHSSSSLSVGRYPHTTFRSPSPFELT